MKKLILASCLLPLVFITGCDNKPQEKACHITTGDEEYVYSDFSKEECVQEVQSLIDKGMVDAEFEWKMPAK